MDNSGSEERVTLLRALGPGMAVAIVVGNVIGSGIFATPGGIAADGLGFPLIISAWITGGVLSLLGALCFAELGAMLPRAGGMYVYLKHAYGRPVGYLQGWTQFIFGNPGSLGALSIIFAAHLGELLYPDSTEGISRYMTVGLAVSLIVGLATVNVIGVLWGGWVQSLTTVFKVGVVLAVAVLPFCIVGNHERAATIETVWSAALPMVEGTPSAASRFAIVLLAVMWAYNGWHGITPVAEEVRDPGKNIPRALLIGVGILTVLYVSANLAYHLVVPMEEMIDGENRKKVAVLLFDRLLGPFGGQLMAVGVMVSTFGAINSNLLLGPRVPFAMGRDDRLLGPDVHAVLAAEAEEVANSVGYPVVIRPSYVLGGRAMEIVHDVAALRRYMTTAVKVSGSAPVLIDSYLRDAIELDVDALADGQDVFVAGIMEHIEEAGIHSGDSACVLPPHTISADMVSELRRQTQALARGLDVVGLMNVQFAVKGDDVYVLEVNPRASRTVPFVAKATGIPIAKIAARIIAGEKLAGFNLPKDHLSKKHVAVKEAVFPFDRFPGVDIILGPEMRSTGEVMGLDSSFEGAFAKSQLASGTVLPNQGVAFVSVRDGDKAAIEGSVKQLADMGFSIIATRGTADFLTAKGIKTRSVNKVLEGSPHIIGLIKSGGVQLVLNTTEGAQAIADSFSLRRAALVHHIPYYTTVAGARAAVGAIAKMRAGTLEVAPLQSYSRTSH